MINGQYIVLSFKEWNNLVSQGYLKFDTSRIKPYLSTKESFFNLMCSAADITYLEDNEYILALLSKDYSKDIFQSSKTLANYLDFKAIECFYALTQRGKTSLTHSANNLQVNLDVDKNIELFWEEYRLDQKNILEHEKAIKFCALFFNDIVKTKQILLDKLNEAELNSNFNPDMFSLLQIENLDEKSHKFLTTLESYENTKAYGGMLSRFLFHVQVSDEKAISQYNKISEFCNSKEHYASLRGQQTSSELTSDYLDKKILREKILSEYILIESNTTHLPLLALSLYFHYEMIIKNGYDLNLSAFKNDIIRLSFFYEQPDHDVFKNIPYLLVYKLAKLIPESFINTLYYYKNKDFKCFNPSNKHQLEDTLPNVADVEFLDTTLNQINEWISKDWSDLTCKGQIQEPYTTGKNVEQAELTNTNLENSLSSEHISCVNSQTTVKVIKTDTTLYEYPLSLNNSNINSTKSVILDKPLSPVIDKLTQPDLLSANNLDDGTKYFHEEYVSHDNAGKNTLDGINKRYLLIDTLCQIFKENHIKDINSLISILKKIGDYSDIKTQGKLREKLILEKILHENSPKTGEKLFEEIKSKIN